MKKSRIVRSVLVGLASIALYYWFTYSPDLLDPVIWDDPPQLPSLTGPLQPNKILGFGEILKPKVFIGPESLSIDDDDKIYASLKTGRVVQLDVNGEITADVLFVGGFIAGKTYLKQAGFNGVVGNQRMINYCTAEAKAGRLPWSQEDERRCGRPLGQRIRKDESGQSILYVLDAYHGLFTVNLKTMKVAHIFGDKTPIQSFDGMSVDATRPIKFYNDLAILADGSIVFTDSSYKNTRSENRQEIMDAAPRGRLLQYNLSTGILRPVLCGLHFPNGVEVHSEGEAGSKVIIAESTRFRLLLVDMGADEFAQDVANPLLTTCSEKGALYKYLEAGNELKKLGSNMQPSSMAVSVFLSPVPGFADNIRVDSPPSKHAHLVDPTKKKFLVCLGTKESKPFSLVWFAFRSKILRQVIGKLIPMRYLELFTPRYGLVLVVDMNGEIVGSMQDPSGRIALVSEAHRHPATGDLWLGSHSESFVRVPRSFLPRLD